MKTDPELWRRIDAFSADRGDAAFPFSARLARDNHWSPSFAERVIAEYKRFLYLACVSPTAVTPSDEVDQAWHLHLTYSRSYWLDLCPQVLHRDLHHGPTKGGRTEDVRYREQYVSTLALYREQFGRAAPSDIWPSINDRFSNAARLRWVDTSRFWVIPRPAVAVGATLALGLTTIVFSIGQMTHAFAVPVAHTADKSAVGPLVLFVLVAAFALLCWLAHLWSKKGRRTKPGTNTSSGIAGCGSSSSSNCDGGSGCGGGGCGGGG